MPVAPSFQDLLTQGQAEAQARQPLLTFIDGDITVAQLHAAAAMADAVLRFGAQAFKSTFIDGAEGAELTALVDDHYNIQRTAASQSQVTVDISRPSAGGGEPAGTILAGTTIATEFDANGEEVQFTTDANVVWLVGELGPKSVVATAVDAGRTSNVKAATVTRIIDVPTFDGTFQVTNPLASGGGNDEETDEELRARVREFFLTLRRGTLAAIEFGAKQVSTVRVATATEDSGGNVTLQVTDSDGNSSAQMVLDVVAELENWRCAGTIIAVVGGTKLELDMSISLTVSPGFDVDAISATFATAVSTRMSKLGAGETMFLDSIIGALVGVAPDDVLDVTFDSITATPGGAQPIADVVPAAGQVVRAGTITVTGA